MWHDMRSRSTSLSACTCVYAVTCKSIMKINMYVYTHMGESYHAYKWIMSQLCVCAVTCEWVFRCEWVMSHMNQSCPIWKSHVPSEWVMSHMDEPCPIWMSRLPMSTRHVSYINESCPVCMSVSFAGRVITSCHTQISFIWISRPTHVTKSDCVFPWLWRLECTPTAWVCTIM